MQEIDPGVKIKAAAANFCQWLEETGDIYGAYVSTNTTTVMIEAERLAFIATKRPDLMTLAGLTVGVKDNICTEMYPTYMGSPSWLARGGFDARVIATMRDRGALIVGKTKTAELAVHDAPDTAHPFYPKRQVGTSSSGSAVAVAVGSCDVALGTQTAGSIARPASFVGVRYIKPTYGLLPRTGVLKTTDDFDTLGLLGQKFSVLESVLRETIPDQSNHPLLQAGLAAQGPSSNRIVIPTRHGEHELDRSYEFQLREVLNRFEDIVADIEYLRLPQDLVQRTRQAHQVVYAWSIRYYLHEELAHELRNLAVRELYLAGASVSAKELEEARETLRTWRAWIRSHLRGATLAEPATAAGAPLIDGVYEQADNNMLWTAAGLPTVGFPVLRDEGGLTMSMQLVGDHYSDFHLLSLGEHFDRTAE